MMSRSLAGLLVGLTLTACGDRSGLMITEASFATDGPFPAHDASVVPARDASLPPTHDARPPADVEDAFTMDRGVADAVVPPIDDASDAADSVAPAMPEAGVVCTDGGFPLAYILDSQGAFYTFDPLSLATRVIGTPACGDSAGVWDFSVSREGNAYVIFEDWNLFKVDLRTLSCTATAFVNGQLGVDGNFTSAVVPTAQGEEMLFFGQTETSGAPILAGSDLSSFILTEVGPVMGAASVADVKADALGRLFGLSSAGLYMQIDPGTGALLQSEQTSFSSGSWALLLFGRETYFFGGSTVFQYDASSHAVTQLGTVGPTVVGASAVPCLHVP